MAPHAHPERRPPPVNALAALALGFAFVLPPCGVLLGLLAMNQMQERRRDGEPERGEALALAGIALGAAATIAVLVVALTA